MCAFCDSFNKIKRFFGDSVPNDGVEERGASEFEIEEFT